MAANTISTAGGLNSLPEIPTIDLRDPDLKELRKACIEVGFFYVNGHGVEESLLERLYAQMRAFFSSPEKEKERVKVDHNFRGFTAMGEENLDPMKQKSGDRKEGFYIACEIDEQDPLAKLPFHGPNNWPSAARFPGWRETMTEYHNRMREVGLKLASLCGSAVGLPKNTFLQQGRFDRPMATLRLLHYAPEKSCPQDGLIGCGAHSDYGFLTLLSTDSNPGLEILHKGKWIQVQPNPSMFIVNLGDMFARWTNDTVKSTVHRVVNRTGADRYSAAFFLDPNYECEVSPFDEFCKNGERKKYPPTTAGQYIQDKYSNTYSSYDEKIQVGEVVEETR